MREADPYEPPVGSIERGDRALESAPSGGGRVNLRLLAGILAAGGANLVFGLSAVHD